MSKANRLKVYGPQLPPSQPPGFFPFLSGELRVAAVSGKNICLVPADYGPVDIPADWASDSFPGAGICNDIEVTITRMKPAQNSGGKPEEKPNVKPDGKPHGTPNGKPPAKPQEVPKPSNLEALQTPQQRKVLDAIDQLRNCGLDKELSLPQLVVCGDQSAGKSSVLEALTEINFPRADNLCTRFATEIILRRDTKDHITIKIIPDEDRPDQERQNIKAFTDNISDFSMLSTELARIIEAAKKVMGIGESSRTFARDILSIEIRGPARIPLTVVDLPGIIQNEAQAGDKVMVDRLTKQYICQPRTICLAVITAMNDADNQRILTLVKEEDPKGLRSLGIITKPDTLAPGSGNEASFIHLAANKHHRYFFSLGWHVLKNRKFEETAVSFQDRNRLEAEFFKTSNFKQLDRDSLGIITLRIRLSEILFEHVKRELPGMRGDVDQLITATEKHLKKLGISRSNAVECREYLMQLSEELHQTGKCAISGTYDTEYLYSGGSIGSKVNTRRLRARIQQKNENFASTMRMRGHTLHIYQETGLEEIASAVLDEHWFQNGARGLDNPKYISYAMALSWVNEMITENRGRELQGNYNPLVISQMFWFQSKRWKAIAMEHVKDITDLCRTFVYDLLTNSCAADVRDNVWTEHLEEIFKCRESLACEFLEDMMRLHFDHPINHNHYYSDTIQKVRSQRKEQRMKKQLEANTSFNHTDIAKAVMAFAQETERDQQKFCCEEALDCMRSIYKVKQKVFIDNVVTLIIEGRIVRGLENIFSPKVVNRMKDEDVERLASEPDVIKRERAHCEEQLEKLKNGQQILKNVLK